MRTILKLIAAFALCSLLSAQVPMTGAGKGTPGAGVTYQGPGDIVSGATFWGSCARAYNAAYANGTNSLCDLVDSAAPTSVICTLRVKTTGFVDLTGTYCTGSVTPATKCAAATGGICNVSKVYDQTGNSNHLTQTTALNQPTLTFSALNSLPGMSGVLANNPNIGSPNLTISQPYTMVTVSERTGSFTTEQVAVGSGTATIYLGYQAVANTALSTTSSAITATASDSAFHALQSVYNGASGVLTVDGSDTTGNNGTGNFSANTFRFFRGNSGFSLTGIVMEGGIWPSGFTSGNRTSVNSNMHGSNGYNF